MQIPRDVLLLHIYMHQKYAINKNVLHSKNIN